MNAESVQRNQTSYAGLLSGVYKEAKLEQTYVCTCYGVVDLFSDTDKHSTETITAQHHDAPRYILSNEPSGRNIREAPFVNHTDLELQVIEELVGRTPPFTMAGGGYSAPRRTDY